MTTMTSSSTHPASPRNLTNIASLTTPLAPRAWQSAPHPQNSLLATATADKATAIWSLRDFRLLSTITGGHKRSVRTVAWKDTGPRGWGAKSGDGNEAEEGEDDNDDEEGGGGAGGAGRRRRPIVLATGSFDSNVGIWTKNERYGRKLLGSGSDGEEDDMEGDGDSNAEEEEEWAFSSLLTGPDSEIKSVAFSPTNPALLATSSRDKSVWVWEDVADSGGGGPSMGGGFGSGGGGGGGGEDSEYETIAVLAEHTGDVKCVAWHPEREVLASGSYDDTVRLWRDVEEEGDWCCIGFLEGHEGTVWGVAWEGSKSSGDTDGDMAAVPEPRLITCSDDQTVRVWKKTVKESARPERSGPRLPSIIRPASSMEEWQVETILPRTHVRSIYAVAWSSRTGLVVTCGGDGGIYVYQERQAPPQEAEEAAGEGSDNDDVVVNGTAANETPRAPPPPPPATEWVVVAQVEGAHAEFEINHVCWAKRYDRDARRPDEEVIVSSGDDGAVKVWAIA